MRYVGCGAAAVEGFRARGLDLHALLEGSVDAIMAGFVEPALSEMIDAYRAFSSVEVSRCFIIIIVIIVIIICFVLFCLFNWITAGNVQLAAAQRVREVRVPLRALQHSLLRAALRQLLHHRRDGRHARRPAAPASASVCVILAFLRIFAEFCANFAPALRA